MTALAYACAYTHVHTCTCFLHISWP